MKIRNCFFCLLILSAGFGAVSCDSALTFLRPSDKRITVMTWNAQTFFDSVEDGSEFDEFKGTKSGWSEKKYHDRLDRLCEVVLACGKKTGKENGAGPDIVVLEEIENGRVVRDICNRLPQRLTYRSAAFIPPSRGCAFGTAILSRYPISDVTAHSVAGGEVSLRPLLEVTLAVGDDVLVVFAVHWKSKVGDSEEETGSIRRGQEQLLASRIARLESDKPGCLWIACGDFNERRDEFTVMNRYPNCWDDWLDRCKSGEAGGPEGSYCYKNTWETIDNFFVAETCPRWRVEAFAVLAESPFAGTGQAPVRYEVFSGKGYSDHLPLVMVLEKR